MEKFKFVIFFLLSALLAESCADSTILIMDGPETVTSDEQTVYYKPLFFPDAKVTLISVAYSLYDMSWNYVDGAGYVEAQYYKKGDCYAEDWFRVKASGSTVEVSFAETYSFRPESKKCRKGNILPSRLLHPQNSRGVSGQCKCGPGRGLLRFPQGRNGHNNFRYCLGFPTH